MIVMMIQTTEEGDICCVGHVATLVTLAGIAQLGGNLDLTTIGGIFHVGLVGKLGITVETALYEINRHLMTTGGIQNGNTSKKKVPFVQSPIGYA